LLIRITLCAALIAIYFHTMKLTSFLLFILSCSAGILSAQNRPANTTRPVVIPVTPPAAYAITAVNFIRVWTPAMPASESTTVTSPSRTVAEVGQETQYFDGLGRLLQTVEKGASPAGRDLVSPVVYDAFGREQYKYLPYVPKTGNVNDGLFKTSPFVHQRAFYRDSTMIPGTGADSIYYAQTAHEASPLNRVLQTWAPGNSWAREGGNHPVRQQHLVNSSADSVRLWELPATSVIPVGNRAYGNGELLKDVSINEAGTQTITYKDKEGRVVLRKTQLAGYPGTAHTGWLCTYYVYDARGDLRFIIPPKAILAISNNWVIHADVVKELCFIYRYDNRRRPIVQKVPGADSTEMLYDARDRLIGRRDGILKSLGMWHGTYYDQLNREQKTALFYDVRSRDAMQTAINQAGFDPLNAFPFIDSTALRVLTDTYYDSYNFPGRQPYITTDITKVQAGANPYAEALQVAPSIKTRGLVTGKRYRIEAVEQFNTTTIYYNDKGRVIQTIADNMPGGKDVTNTLYDFSGKVLSTYLKHTNPRSTLTPQTTVLTMFDYDAAGRIDSIKKRINDNPVLQRTVAVNSYDELGRLKTKRLDVTGTAAQLELLQYEYNIRGWLKSINRQFVNTPNATSNWFGQDYSYDYGFDSVEYNGNIAGIRWKSLSDNIPRAYGYDYDRADRLTRADFAEQLSSNAAWTNTKADFSVSGLTYDGGGNLLSMKQMGLNGPAIQTIDSLKYGYFANSHRLSYVTDKKNNPTSVLGDFKETDNREVQDYWYDPNGNIAKDKNKAIDTIYYNHQQLPAILYAKNRQASIHYLYAGGTGERLAKMVSDATFQPQQFSVTHYINGFQYEQDSLQFISHEEGRIRPIYRTGQLVTYAFDYFIKDQLGNVRMVLSSRKDTAIYAATMETAAAGTENALFSNIDNTRAPKPANYPQDNTTNPNAYVSRLNAINGRKIGPSLVLRLVAGDSIQIAVRALYRHAGAATSNTTAAAMVTAILQAFSGTGAEDGIHQSTGSTSPVYTLSSSSYTQLKTKDASQNLPDKPKAYLSYLMFDDQFNLVDENSGVRQVAGAIDALQTLVLQKMRIKKTGFIYIYTSNESGQDVFFDNLVVTHNGGPLLEETHYYPFGLTMAGISRNALKGAMYPENRKLYNGIDFSQDLDLQQYDAFYRTLDPQIGRWRQIDPKIDNMEAWSPYASNFDNPIRYSDLLGDWPGLGDGLWARLLNFAGNAKDNFRNNTNRQKEFVREKVTQGINNFKNRIATGTTTPQLLFEEIRKNPLAAVTSIGGLEVKLTAVTAQEFALGGKGAGVGPMTAEGLELTAKMSGKLDGAGRAAKYSNGWSEASLQGAIDQFAPGAKGFLSKDKQKTIYLNSETGIQVVYDNLGDYFRIENLQLKGKRTYIDFTGAVPNNKIVNGKQMGRSKEEYHQITHYNNID
jgi:RHS repeat-associated protein